MYGCICHIHVITYEYIFNTLEAKVHGYKHVPMLSSKHMNGYVYMHVDALCISMITLE